LKNKRVDILPALKDGALRAILVNFYTSKIQILVAEHDEVVPHANAEKLYVNFKNERVIYKVLRHTDHNTIAQRAEY
jgi:esterase/lipase